MVLCHTVAVCRMSIWVLFFIYTAEVCFLWISWIYGLKAGIFLVVLTSDALFRSVSAMSVSLVEV
jgi:hypothetical protein